MRKKFQKKLSLNKKTIVDLRVDQMRVVKGGGTNDTICCETDPSYDSCDTACNTAGDCTYSCTWPYWC